jgi:hypothetical protein
MFSKCRKNIQQVKIGSQYYGCFVNLVGNNYIIEIVSKGRINGQGAKLILGKYHLEINHISTEIKGRIIEDFESVDGKDILPSKIIEGGRKYLTFRSSSPNKYISPVKSLEISKVE